MKYQVLFSLKNNEKVFINVVCCSLDWLFKGYMPEMKIAEFANSIDPDQVAHVSPHLDLHFCPLAFEFPI